MGVGLLTYNTLDEATAAITRVEADYAMHAKASRDIAQEFFDAHNVLSKLLAQATS